MRPSPLGPESGRLSLSSGFQASEAYALFSDTSREGKAITDLLFLGRPVVSQQLLLCLRNWRPLVPHTTHCVPARLPPELCAPGYAETGQRSGLGEGRAPRSLVLLQSLSETLVPHLFPEDPALPARVSVRCHLCRSLGMSSPEQALNECPLCPCL